MKHFIKIAAIVFFIFYLKSIDYVLLIEQLKQLGWNFLFVIVVSGCAYLFAAIGWMLCLNTRINFSWIKNIFLVRLIGESFGTINPTGVVGGDVLKVYLLKFHRITKRDAAESVTVSRVLILLSFLILVIGLLFYLLIFYDFSEDLKLHGFLVFLLTVFTGFIIALFFHPKLYLYKGVFFFSKRLGFKSFLKVSDKIKIFNQAASEFCRKHKTLFVLAFICFLLHWILGAYEFYLILHFLDIDISWSAAFVLEVGTSFARSLMPFVPGQLGVEEYSNKLFLNLIGVQGNETWVAVSMIKRVRQLFWIITGCAIYFFKYRDKNNKVSSIKITDHGSLVH